MNDLQITTNSFNEMGGLIFSRLILAWNLAQKGIQVRTNVKAPQALAKMAAVGSPRPYRSQDDAAGNGARYTDRIITAYQSKWDYDFDPEDFRNTYLARVDEQVNFAEASNNEVAKKYLDYLIRTTLYNGVRNGAGSAPADICDGFGTILARDITAAKFTNVVATGAITAANAVDQVEKVAEAVDKSIREGSEPFYVHCSYAVIDFYKKNYRTLNGYRFAPQDDGKYKLDGINAYLEPQAMMGNSQRLIATVNGNLVVGTDTGAVQVHASVRRNVIEVRQMMPVGAEFQDLECMWTNDLA